MLDHGERNVRNARLGRYERLVLAVHFESMLALVNSCLPEHQMGSAWLDHVKQVSGP